MSTSEFHTLITGKPSGRYNLPEGAVKPLSDDDGYVLGREVAVLDAASDLEPIGDADVDQPSDREPMSHLHAGGQQVG